MKKLLLIFLSLSLASSAWATYDQPDESRHDERAHDSGAAQGINMLSLFAQELARQQGSKEQKPPVVTVAEFDVDPDLEGEYEAEVTVVQGGQVLTYDVPVTLDPPSGSVTTTTDTATGGGETTAADGSVTTADGSAAADGGTTTTDGTAAASDGGTTTTDGSTTTTDGSTTSTADGGTTTTDGTGDHVTETPRVPEEPHHPPIEDHPKHPPTTTGGIPFPPPIERPPCSCDCSLDERWDAFSGIESTLMSPLPGAGPAVVQVPLGKRIPLVADGGDLDRLTVLCQRHLRGGPACEGGCHSKLEHQLPITLKYHWEIREGEGELVNHAFSAGSRSADGPATLYQAPAGMPADPEVTIRLTVDESESHRRNEDDAESVREVKLKLVPPEQPLQFGIGPPFANWPDQPRKEGRCLCQPAHEWRINGPMSGMAQEGGYTCPNDYVVLSALGTDSDLLRIRCADDMCPSSGDELSQSDFVYYEWAPSAGRIIGGRTEKVVLQAPDTPGPVTIEPALEDSQLQATDARFDMARVTVHVLDLKLTEIKGLRRQAAGDFSQEPDPHADGRLFLDTQDDGVINTSPDVERVKLTVEVEPPEAPLGNVKVKWEVRDPDDPAAHADIDPDAKGGDNTGTPHEGEPHYFMQAEHAMTDQIDRAAADETTVIGEAKTELTRVGGKWTSTAYFHYTDDAGDNFVIDVFLVKGDAALTCHDQSGTLTTWRQREVHAYAMSKDNDDNQVQAVGAAPGAFTVCIDPGANGVSDTLVLTPDDGRIGENVHAGADGTCDTAANSGANDFDPDAAQALFHRHYAEADPDHLPYIDFTVTQKQKDRTFRRELPLDDIWDYMHNHTDYAAHPEYRFSLIGLNAISTPPAMAMPPGTVIVGYAGHPPHSGASAGHLKRHAPLQLPKTDIHEVGHLIINEVEPALSFHTVHTGGEQCGFQQGMHPPQICPRHVNLLRDSIRRTFTGAHAGGMETYDSTRTR
ncbi:MAG: hypothetical protein COW12_02465 [Candidatus Omnitrophica bacterium CG12_big_fil_rev_8_21_14_0_65_45_16]|nr:MAG: hypothetical protein COW12_02465 [Candidatus Omnitrophica bacterium CG12_big_fil_rev_8_21_14_0_65_45_16]